MFERLHRKIVRTMQGLLTRSALHVHLGGPPINLEKRLLFLHSILRLRNHCCCKKTLLCRLNVHARSSKSWSWVFELSMPCMKSLLLSSCQSLRNNLPSAAACNWKKTVYPASHCLASHQSESLLAFTTWNTLLRMRRIKRVIPLHS